MKHASREVIKERLALLVELEARCCSWEELAHHMRLRGHDVTAIYCYNLHFKHRLPNPVPPYKMPEKTEHKPRNLLPKDYDDRVKRLIPMVKTNQELWELVKADTGIDMTFGSFMTSLYNHGITPHYSGIKVVTRADDMLCWTCVNAVPDRAGKRGCEWSRSCGEMPVDGSVFTRSGYIKSCPKYEEG